MRAQVIARGAVCLVGLGLLLAPAALAKDGQGTSDAHPSSATVSLEEAIRGAVDWLVANQQPTGAWGSHHSPRPIEVLCDVPGSHDTFRVATTALCVMGLEDSPISTEESRAAASRGVDSILASYDVKRPSGFEHYSVWAFGYGLQCLGEWLLAHPDDPQEERLRKACAEIVAKLGRYQCLDGGWGYLSLDEVPTYQPSWTSMSFTTATVLVGLERAKRAGVAVPDRMIRRAVASVERTRTPVESFHYGEIWRRSTSLSLGGRKGSACRTPACQYGILLFDAEVSEKARTDGLEDLLVRQLHFQKIGVRRPIPHEAWYAISGYFYLYGMAYASYILEGLPEADRKRYSGPLLDAVLYCRQPDGSFWDYPLYSYHKPYGTGFALIALSRVDR